MEGNALVSKKTILALGVILLAIGIYLFPFGYDLFFYALLGQAGNNYALAVAYAYTICVGLIIVALLLVWYAKSRKHFTNPYIVFGLILLTMLVIFFIWQGASYITPAAGPPSCP
jgi:O-antigen ligase